MLTEVADGVLVHQSEFCQTNSVVVRGAGGVLLVDAGILGDELACLADDVAGLGETVVAGFSTHPHWDHMVWHPRLGDVPRHATARGAETARVRLAGGIEAAAKAVGIPEGVPFELLGDITGLPEGATDIPWEGPRVRVIEHQAHAPGHAALLIEARRVLVAGDMLSDVLVPMLDLNGTDDPIEDYLTALQLLERAADGADVVVPGHGSVGGADELRDRIDRDRAYVLALREGRDPEDQRVGSTAKPGWEWVSDVHAGQLARLAQRS